MPRHAEILRQIADEFPAAAVARRKAQQRRLSRRFANDSQERLDKRRLASAIAAEQAKDFAPLDAQADALQCLLPLAAQQTLDVGLRQIARFNRRLFGHNSLASGRLTPGVYHERQ